MMETLTLILDDCRIKVNKEKLASKSCYFASLFSHNFNDSHDKEHVINYDIPLVTLENFVEWIHDDMDRVEIQCHSLKASMTKFVNKNFTELLSLLQLSVLFVVDELTNDAIDIIVINWLLPEKLIDIWLLAQELNVKVLQDICLATCLDRFEELPLPSLVELSKKNITLLLQYVNVRASTEYLQFVRNEWIQHHMRSDIPDIKDERQLKFIQGIVVYKMYECTKKDPYLYIWNNNVFSKCTELKHKQCSENSIMGMQVASRGFNIYTVGGEMGLGTGKFNDIIWCYSLISKKWYYQAKLPIPRRHMVVAFLKNKLTIVGGVGKHRLKLFSVDILDIHTGKWKKGAKVPESFTDIQPYCVKDGKLFLLLSTIYIYYIEGNYWQTILNYKYSSVRVDEFFAQDATLFLLTLRLGEPVLSRIDIVKLTMPTDCKKEQFLKHYVEHTTFALPAISRLTSTVHEDYLYQLRYANVTDIGIMLLNDGGDDKYQFVYLNSETRTDLRNFCIPKSGCFNIMDPDTLYNIM